LCGKVPGEWFGPSATATCIQELVHQHQTSRLLVYITGDHQEVNEEAFLRIARSKGDFFTPTLILIGTRLGIDHVNPRYWKGLLACLQMPQSVGIAGGRPSSSHYFVGTQDDQLFYLDPHHTRPALRYLMESDTYDDDHIESCYTDVVRRLHLSAMDPSMLIGFYIRGEQEWQDWKHRVQNAHNMAPVLLSESTPQDTIERPDAIDEVKSLSDSESLSS
jgi:cysteine protease ATG4